MKKLFLSLLFLAAFGSLQAQGSISETVEPKVEQLMRRFVRLNQSQPTVDGWRIQILATTDRQRMEQALRKFQYDYPTLSADWIHAKPYYKIQAGAFATKRDALRALYTLKEKYSSAFPVQDDKIRPEELLR